MSEGNPLDSISCSSLFLGTNFHLGFNYENVNRQAIPQCDTVIGVESGDTCFHIIQNFNMTTEFFESIKPNLNCDELFIGQWLCVAGAPN
ncbi:hypothetical protein PVL29_012763 [Vitis rotundifolia]|uniref:LysM domain-containing protein n=1 Tax=Vitis rotundifolia TaxID=103349 RepID=A0AA38ZJU8_VITRO|nr:hypothetical protein PVL29_012763 [Vitis rotundifolia]